MWHDMKHVSWPGNSYLSDFLHRYPVCSPRPPGQFVRFNFHKPGAPPFICGPRAGDGTLCRALIGQDCSSLDPAWLRLTKPAPSLIFLGPKISCQTCDRYFCCLVLNNKRVESNIEASGHALHTTRIYLHKINCMRINPETFHILVLCLVHCIIPSVHTWIDIWVWRGSLLARWLQGVGPQWIISIIPFHLNIWSLFS